MRLIKNPFSHVLLVQPHFSFGEQRPPHTPHDQPIIPALLWFPSCVARPDDLQEIHLALELHRADGATYVEWIYLNIASMDDIFISLKV